MFVGDVAKQHDDSTPRDVHVTVLDVLAIVRAILVASLLVPRSPSTS